MPYVNKPRPYKEEYKKYHSSDEQKKDRAARNKLRQKAEREGRVKKGDGKDVHHVDALANGGARDGKVRVVSAASNRSFARDANNKPIPGKKLRKPTRGNSR